MIKYLKKMNYLRKQKLYKNYINSILDVVDFRPIVNEIPNRVSTITFVIPGMPAYSGGHTSILRLGSELSKNGYIVRYTSFTPQSIEEMKKNAAINLENYQGEFIEYTGDSMKSDVIIATSWDSVYFARKMTGYKMYFVQDYEPYFHLYGECYLMAKKTYELGFHIVSLGQWNKYMIEKECKTNSRIDYITFPYEGGEYYDRGRDFNSYKSKKEFNIAVYVKDTGKRAPYLIQYLLKRLKEDFDKDGLKLNIKYFGESVDFKCDAGENLGKLGKKELLELYSCSDFGMVGSLTNISLVPYEMLATGLPIIEFEEGTFKYFFPENSAIVTSFDYNELYKKLKACIEEPNRLKEINKTAKEYLSTLSWKNTAIEFDKILKNVINREG